MNRVDPDSSAYYHDGDPDDPYVEDHQRRLPEDHWWPCPTCDHTDRFEPSCRCTCHTQRRYS